MVLAAGLGTRLRPLTDERPKALVEVGGRALIDHILDRLVAAGVTRAVVNVHAFADLVEAHLRQRRDVEIVISDERARLLETGGAVKHARPLLGEAPIWVANSDYVWTQQAAPALDLVAAAWDASRMDACLIVVPKARTLGFNTAGDFFMARGGALTYRGTATTAPLHCFGIQILDPTRAYDEPAEAFSLLKTWLAAQQRGRLFGVSPPGLWMQVGDPAALEAAQARLATTP
jgi:MurNAc alpha-1-phosphate uridylyltransferase